MVCFSMDLSRTCVDETWDSRRLLETNKAYTYVEAPGESGHYRVPTRGPALC